MSGSVEIQKLRLKGLQATVRALCDRTPEAAAARDLGRTAINIIEGMLAEPEPAGALGKRPVAFRYKGRDGAWLLTEDEGWASLSAQQYGTQYQGLYAREGT